MNQVPDDSLNEADVISFVVCAITPSAFTTAVAYFVLPFSSPLCHLPTITRLEGAWNPDPEDSLSSELQRMSVTSILAWTIFPYSSIALRVAYSY